jgi:hypothetical protein
MTLIVGYLTLPEGMSPWALLPEALRVLDCNLRQPGLPLQHLLEDVP